jgi:prephenate dehydrogenase
MATITIIGTGLIGSSLGMALRNQGHFVIGCDKSQKNLELAKHLNAIDVSSQSNNQSTCRQAGQSVVLLATPVDHILDILPQVLDNLPSNAVVIDTGSTKMAICQKVKNHPRRNAFVAAHPMAGSEQSGPQAAKSNLFVNKRVAICESELSSQASLSKAIELFESIGLEPIFMSPEEHDSSVALVSHLPQILAYAFASLPEFHNENSKDWSNVASSGFDSSTRLALSVPEVWLPILFQNKMFLVDALRSLSQNIDMIADCIMNSNTIPLRAKMEQAKKTRVQFDEQQKIVNQVNEIITLTK